jgi:histone-lysine N-methyltransferase SETMAR
MNKEAIRFYINTRTILGVSPTDIHKELTTVYGPEVVSYSTVQKRAKLAKDGEMEIEDKSRSGRPVTGPTPENIQEVQRIINEDPRSTYDDIEAEASLSHGTVFTIIHDHLKLKKLSSRWVPKQLTPEQKQQRVKICRENLKRFEEGSLRLSDIITGDETWIYLRQVGRKQSNSCWVAEGESPGTVAKRGKYEPKVLYSIFFRSTGTLYVHALDKGTTIDRYYYIKRCLKPMIKEIKIDRPLSGVKNLKLLHDNAPAHDNQDVLSYLKKEGLNLLPHPPYSPDLSPCDYWLNDYIKCNLSDENTENSLFKEVTSIVFNIPTEEYKKTFDKLLVRMKLCIQNNGDYFEHLIK